MKLDDAAREAPAQRALVRMLRLVLPEEGKLQSAVNAALATARLSCLPADPESLLIFVKLHLAPRLRDDVPLNLVMALINDLTAEIEHLDQ